MNRPTRQRQHLLEKIDRKQSRTPDKAGKRTKRWKKWADKHKLAYTTYTDLAGRNDVYDMIQRELDGVNQTLAAAARIRKFVLLYKELDADDGELTRTRKIRRAFVEERYAEIIAALYRDDARVAVDTTIRFQDGKTAHIQTELAIRVLGVS